MKEKWAVIVFIIIGFCLSTAVGTRSAAGHIERIAQIARLEGGESSQTFGRSVATSGNILAVGDPNDSQAGIQVGAVTIFQLDMDGKWGKIARITPSAALEGMRFGTNIALSSNRLVVGAPGNSDLYHQLGSAYIYERNEGGPDAWGEVARLTASDGLLYDNYGWAVTTNVDTVVIGAFTHAIGGRVYIYERDEGGPGAWGETAQLSPDEPGFQACFGESLDLDGDLLAVGAYGGGDYSGYVYVFSRVPSTHQWQRLTRFKAADTAAYHYFGYAVALDDWTILAGAPGADGLTGAAYIFTSDPEHPENWIELDRLAASDGAMGEYFGITLDLSGSRAWVGAPWHNSGAGRAYLFEEDHAEVGEWGETGSVAGNDTQEGDEFSYSTAIDGELAVAGAPGAAPPGAAYVFDLDQHWEIWMPLVRR